MNSQDTPWLRPRGLHPRRAGHRARRWSRLDDVRVTSRNSSAITAHTTSWPPTSRSLRV